MSISDKARRFLSLAAVLFCAGSVAASTTTGTNGPNQSDYNVGPLMPSVRHYTAPVRAELVSYTASPKANGGGGTGGSGGAAGLPLRLKAMRWAHAQGGCWYAWGGTSCATGFDCSGLVMEAYRHAGVQLPRTTYEMLGSRHLRRVYVPRRGDLAFYGSGHVELVWQPRWDRTWGAHDRGTRVGSIKFYPGTSWAPTAYYQVVR